MLPEHDLDSDSANGLAGGGLSFGILEHGIVLRARKDFGATAAKVKLQGPPPLVRTVRGCLMGNHAREKEGTTRLQGNRGERGQVQLPDVDLTIPLVLVPESSRLVLPAQHVHAPILDGGLIDGDPDAAGGLKRLHGKVGVVLMPRLGGSDLRWLDERHALKKQGIIINEGPDNLLHTAFGTKDFLEDRSFLFKPHEFPDLQLHGLRIVKSGFDTLFQLKEKRLIKLMKLCSAIRALPEFGPIAIRAISADDVMEGVLNSLNLLGRKQVVDNDEPITGKCFKILRWQKMKRAGHRT